MSHRVNKLASFLCRWVYVYTQIKGLYVEMCDVIHLQTKPQKIIFSDFSRGLLDMEERFTLYIQQFIHEYIEYKTWVILQVDYRH